MLTESSTVLVYCFGIFFTF